MTLAAQSPATPELTAEELRTRNRSLQQADRCDRCPAEALVRVHLSNGELFFCGHDFAIRELNLLPLAIHVHDERPRLAKAEGFL